MFPKDRQSHSAQYYTPNELLLFALTKTSEKLSPTLEIAL